MSLRRVAYLAALAALTVSLAGCESLRKEAGLTKVSPDEFAVVTKAPLIIPPEYNLKPPKPGAAPTNQVGPTDAAQAAMYGANQPVTSNRGQLSVAEQEVLSKAGASNANDMIRQKIAADNHAMQEADSSFTNKLLFGMASDGSAGKPVDAEAEKRRLDAAKSGGDGAQKPAGSEDTTTIQKDSGGWLDGIF